MGVYVGSCEYVGSCVLTISLALLSYKSGFDVAGESIGTVDSRPRKLSKINEQHSPSHWLERKLTIPAFRV